MSSQEMKKKEKEKETITFEEDPNISLLHINHFDHTEEVSMHSSDQRISTLLEAKKKTCTENSDLEQSKKNNANEVSLRKQKSSITPYIFYTSDEKARLRWSRDLHDCFVNAVTKLGGPQKATPKTVKEIMEVEGIALHHVKSHLQKFRLGKCKIRDETDQSNKRLKNARGVTKTYASSNTLRPQVNIKPKVTGDVKQEKAKEVQGSLYMLIEHDLQLQRCREAQRMQMAFAIENQDNMLEIQKASMVPSIISEQNNYISTTTSIIQHPTSQKLDHWVRPLTIYNSQPPTTIMPETTTYVEDFCNENVACVSMYDFNQHTSETWSITEPPCLYTSTIHSTQGKLEFDDNQNYNIAQGFNHLCMTIEPQSMVGSSTTTTRHHLRLSDDSIISDSYCNATFLPTPGPLAIGFLHRGTSNHKNHFSTTPESMQTHLPHHMYNTLEAVKTQLTALQNSSTSRNREIASRETNLSSTVTRDETNVVDTYIDWGKVEETDIEPDPVEVLEALGFGVNP